MGFARDSFMEELSFNLGLERSAEVKLAEDSKEYDWRLEGIRQWLKSAGC